MALPKIEDFDDPTFDPYFSDELANGVMADPYPQISAERQQCPVQQSTYRSTWNLPDSPTGGLYTETYRVMTYDGVSEVMNHPEVFSQRAFIPSLGAAFGYHSISVLDGQEHAKYRRIFQKAFLPNVVGKWGDIYVQPVVDDLLAEFRHTGKADLVQQFAKLYPFGVIFRMLQMPEDDRPIFQKLMLAQILQAVEPERAAEATRKLGAYFTAMIEDRRANPGDDLVSELAKAEVDGERLLVQHIVDFLRQLFNAGGDTTFRATSVLLTQLLRHPDILQQLKGDRSLIPGAIEETLRWDGPVVVASRYAETEYVVEGITIPAGTQVEPMYGSANRDETKFENADEWDPFRTQSPRHFAFGMGPHVCIGQHLAKVEITRAINSLFDELPNLRLDPEEEPPVIVGSALRAPRNLFVRFEV